jgi:hypothetical protein
MTMLKIVPSNTHETVREMFSIVDAQTIEQIIETENFKTLQQEFNEQAEGIVLEPIDNFEDHFISHPPIQSILKLVIDTVIQRERIDPSHPQNYRDDVIKMALNFKPKHAGFPQGNRVIGEGKQDGDYLQDWQKRALALCLRGVYDYPCSIVHSKLDELAGDFNSQFIQKDNIASYDKFKAELSAGSERHWAMQHCFDRLGCTIYPFAEPPLLTGLGDVSKSMFDKVLNTKEKNTSYSENQFTYFVRAVTVYRRVWPAYSKTRIYGSWIRGCVAIISMLDKNILKGSDEWLVEIFTEAMNPKYGILKAEDNETVIGFVSPTTWTGRQSKNWQGNRFHQNAVQSLAKAWNEIRKDKGNRKDRRIPKLAQYSIDALENAKFQNVEVDA